MEFSELSNRVIGCAIKVHRKLGPGLLESTCEQCLHVLHALHGEQICEPLPPAQREDRAPAEAGGWQSLRWFCRASRELLEPGKLGSAVLGHLGPGVRAADDG